MVLTRAKSETVHVEFQGATLELAILEIRGNRVRLGLIAPPSVVIHKHDAGREKVEIPTHEIGGEAGGA